MKTLHGAYIQLRLSPGTGRAAINVPSRLTVFLGHPRYLAAARHDGLTMNVFGSSLRIVPQHPDLDPKLKRAEIVGGPRAFRMDDVEPDETVLTVPPGFILEVPRELRAKTTISDAARAAGVRFD